ncbi:MAG: cytochrome bc complex cytochrome b subunit, partial [Alphaproteobacteria bacterium]|nr:cytochrome bc complex cytochrome b subunit [Alphaproteobacteria bacterium]
MIGANHRKSYVATTRLGNWIDERLPLPRFLYEHIFNFLIPYNLNYFYTFGAIALFMLVSQIFSGIVMAMHYVPQVSMAFESKEYIKRSVNFGWLFTSIHSIGASFFFLSIYIHMARSLYYGSYKKPRELVWLIGVILFFIMLFIAFTGYVTSWSLVSTTAITVISNFIEKIPLIGPYLSGALLGGTTLGQHSLTRLYALHIILPFILCSFVFLHIWSVHRVGQSNPDGLKLVKPEEFVPFAPYGIIKDCIAICCFALLFALFIFYMPDLLHTSNSLIEGDTANVATSIIPEWYFVPFYTMLRAATFKIGFISASTIG